jgi:hypothetical protein
LRLGAGANRKGCVLPESCGRMGCLTSLALAMAMAVALAMAMAVAMA